MIAADYDELVAGLDADIEARPIKPALAGRISGWRSSVAPN